MPGKEQALTHFTRLDGILNADCGRRRDEYVCSVVRAERRARNAAVGAGRRTGGAIPIFTVLTI